MLTAEERADVVAQTSDAFDQQMLLMWAPLFHVGKIKWKILRRRVIFKTCTLRQAVAQHAVGDVLDHIVVTFGDDGWHARLYATKGDPAPLHMWFHAAWGIERISQS